MKPMYRLTEVRLSKGLSQESLGKKIGVSKQTIFRYESGERFPKPENLKALCDVLNCKLTDIVDITIY